MRIDSTELASYLSAEHDGKSREITGVSSPQKATESDLTYITNKETIKNSEAGVIISSIKYDGEANQTLIKSDTPRTDFILVYDEFFRNHPEETSVAPTSVIEDTAEIGDRCIIGPNVYIGDNVSLGDRCVVYPNASIGMDGFGYTRDGEGKLHRQVHKGGVELGDDVTIGANSCVDSGIFDATTVRKGTKIDNLVQIAHSCEVGKDCMITAGCCLAGSVTAGDMIYMHPHATIYTETKIGDGAEIGMNSTVADDVEAYAKVTGTPARKIGKSRYSSQSG